MRGRSGLRVGLLVGLLALLPAARPIQAAPRLTLKLENASLHETLRRLQAFYGWQIGKGDGAGREGYREPLGTPRSSFDWKEATVGTVFRDLARAYNVSPRMTGADSLAIDPVPFARSGLAVTREGISVSLGRVQQNELRTLTLGAPNPEVDRSITLSLVVRPLDGDPEVLYGLDHLRAEDDLGHELVPAEEDLTRRSPWEKDRFPDEWPVSVRFQGLGARARRLSWVEGEVALYRSAPSYRLEMPLPILQASREWSAGPVRISSVKVARRGNHLEGAYTAAWPRGIEVASGPGGWPGLVQPWVRLRNGSLARLTASATNVAVDDHGTQSAAMSLAPVDLPDEPVALVWDVIARSEPDRRIPFRFAAVPLPFSMREPGALPVSAPPAASTSGKMVLALPALPSRVGQLEVGLSRQEGKGWGPVRWTTVEVDSGATHDLDELRPGTYRVRLTFRPLDARGTAGAPVMLHTSPEAPVRVQAGKAVRVSVTK